MKTSLTHPLEIASVSAGPNMGKIGITFCPGKIDPNAMTGHWYRDLNIDLNAIRDWGASAVVTLLQPDELEKLKVPNLGEEVRRRHMDWLHLPISDYSVPFPAFEKEWVEAGEGLRARLRDGADILLHCKGGLGRAGLLAACLLVELGTRPAQAVMAVRKARKGAIETDEQLNYVLQTKPIRECKPATTRKAIEDRQRGAMLGLAIGDAVGTTLEFWPRDDDAPRVTDMIGGGPFQLKSGQWTDDTSMALMLAYSLQDYPELDEKDLLRRFVSWWKRGDYSCTGTCFDIGNTTRQALQLFIDTGETQSGPSGEYDAGNGSLMRLAPVAIRYWNDAEKRRDVAARQSRTTHGAPEAVDACILFADILADAIAGKPRSQVLRPRQGSYAGNIQAIAEGSWRGKPRHEIRGSGYVVHCLEAALWSVSRTATFRDAVLLAANFREDADTTAAVTGQLAGAIYGQSGIPKEWQERLADRYAVVGAAIMEAY